MKISHRLITVGVLLLLPTAAVNPQVRKALGLLEEAPELRVGPPPEEE